MYVVERSRDDLLASHRLTMGFMSNEERMAEAIAELRHAKWQNRVEAARTLGRIRHEDGVPPLIEALSDSATEVCMAAIESLAALKDIAQPAVLEIIATHPDSSVRYATTMVAGHWQAEPVTEALITALDDADSDVQEGAALALQQQGTSQALAAVEAWRRNQPLSL